MSFEDGWAVMLIAGREGRVADICEGRKVGWMEGWRVELSATRYFELVEAAWGWQARECQWTLCRRRSQAASPQRPSRGLF